MLPSPDLTEFSYALTRQGSVATNLGIFNLIHMVITTATIHLGHIDRQDLDYGLVN